MTVEGFDMMALKAAMSIKYSPTCTQSNINPNPKTYLFESLLPNTYMVFNEQL